MISRHWRGVARASRAGDYVAHLLQETLPQLRRIAGFIDVSVLRRDADPGVEFLVITRWSSMAAIRKYAGHDLVTAVVPDDVRAMMIEYDKTVRHYEVVE